MLNNEEVKKYYQEVENYDWAKAADKFIGPETILHHWREKQVLKLVKKYGQEKYLDMGCGTGLITRHLPKGSVGVDLNSRNIEKAKKHAPLAEYYLADIETRLPFSDNYFLTVVCTEVLEHLLFPEKALTEINRLLSADGCFIGSVPGDSWIWKLRRFSFSRKHFSDEPYHCHRNKKEVIALLSPFFKIIRIYSSPKGMNWFFVCKKI